MRLVYLTCMRELTLEEGVGSRLKGTYERLMESPVQDVEIVAAVFHDMREQVDELKAFGVDIPPWPPKFTRKLVNIPLHDAERFEKSLLELVKGAKIDYILNDSGLHIFSKAFLSKQKVINIHPGLTKGPHALKGLTPTLDALERFRETGYNKTGATLHHMNEKIDDGEVIFSLESTLIEENDTEDSLRAKNFATKQKVLEEGLKKLTAEIAPKEKTRYFSGEKPIPTRAEERAAEKEMLAREAEEKTVV